MPEAPNNKNDNDEFDSKTTELERIRQLEDNPTLRWEHAKDDPIAEAERIRIYKEERRERYITNRLKLLEIAQSERSPTISLRPPV
eukprot:gene2716-5594_t